MSNKYFIYDETAGNSHKGTFLKSVAERLKIPYITDIKELKKILDEI